MRSRHSSSRTRPAPPASTTPARREHLELLGSVLERHPSGLEGRQRHGIQARLGATAHAAGLGGLHRGRRHGAGDREDGALLGVGDRLATRAARRARALGRAATRRRPRPPAHASASPRASWLRMTPELPRAVHSNALAKAASRSPAPCGSCASIRSTPPSKVRKRLVPVSPSGTGNTLSASISTRRAAKTERVSRAHRRTAGTSSTANAPGTGSGARGDRSGSRAAARHPSSCSSSTATLHVRARRCGPNRVRLPWHRTRRRCSAG